MSETVLLFLFEWYKKFLYEVIFELSHVTGKIHWSKESVKSYIQVLW